MTSDEIQIGKAKICLVQADITEQNTDAIVNAANSTLMGGGGVDGAVHRKGGPKILEECKRIRATEWPDGLPTGKAVITSGGDLKAKYVIHTVGPVWRGGIHGEPELLAEAYLNSLRLAVSKRLKSIAFPSISTGAYRYSVEKASRIALTTVKGFLEKEDKLDNVIFVLFTKHDLEVYKQAAKEFCSIGLMCSLLPIISRQAFPPAIVRHFDNISAHHIAKSLVLCLHEARFPTIEFTNIPYAS